MLEVFYILLLVVFGGLITLTLIHYLLTGSTLMTGMRIYFSGYSPLKASNKGLPGAMWSAGSGKFGTMFLAQAQRLEQIALAERVRWTKGVEELRQHRRGDLRRRRSELLGGGRRRTGLDAIQWARDCARRGAGEILLTSMDADGTQAGYDSGQCTLAIAEAMRRRAVEVLSSTRDYKLRCRESSK